MGGGDFASMIDLLAERIGGCALAASDDYFAPMHNLVRPGRGVFIEDRYTDRGKWMDGWESRRRRDDGNDWCILRLGLAGVIHGVCVDTNHFKGNHPESCSIDALVADPSASVEALIVSDAWTEVVARTPLRPHAANLIPAPAPAASGAAFTHVRLNIFPDGGVARLRVHGAVRPDRARLAAGGESIDLIAVEHGGRTLACSDAFFGVPVNLIMPGRGINMGDGWETRRRRGPGHDWVIVALGMRGTIEEIEVDTAHFKGNYPDACSVDACDDDGGGLPPEGAWRTIVEPTKLRADDVHRFGGIEPGPWTHVRLNIFPDGGVSRLRIRGRVVGPG